MADAVAAGKNFGGSLLKLVPYISTAVMAVAIIHGGLGGDIWGSVKSLFAGAATDPAGAADAANTLAQSAVAPEVVVPDNAIIGDSIIDGAAPAPTLAG